MVKKNTNKASNSWDSNNLHSSIKKALKKDKIKVTSRDINKVWEAYLQEEVIKPLSIGAVVKLTGSSTVWVKATPITEHKRAMSMLNKGLIYSKFKVSNAKINMNTSRYIYKIVFESKSSRNKLFIEANGKLKKAVNEGIINGKLITRLNVN